MNTLPWLTLLGLVPLVGALLVLAAPRSARPVALGFAVLNLGLAVAAALQFKPSKAGTYQLAESHSWIPQIGATYSLGVNGLGLAMVLLSVILVPICMIATWPQRTWNPEGVQGDVEQTARDLARKRAQFFAWLLILETTMIGVFAARDVFLFYVFFEVMLIPSYFLIGRFGGPKGRKAAMKFLLFSLTGGLVMLAAVIAVNSYAGGGPTAFQMESVINGLKMSPTAEKWLFAAFFFAFAVKAPMWPVHTWLPDMAESAPPAVSALVVGVLDKVGTFAMIAFCLPMFPNASKWAAPYVIALALVSLIYGAILAIGQRNLLRLVAFTSISHFGFIVLGIFAFTTPSLSGSMLYMVNHGFSTAALFLVIGAFAARRGSADANDFGGMQRVTPVLAGLLLVAGLSGLSLPGLSTFVSEILVIIGTFVTQPWAAVVACVAVVLSALYILQTYKKVATGPVQDHLASTPDATGFEKTALGALIAAILVFGFYPQPLLDLFNPLSATTQQQVQVSDPATVGPAAPHSKGVTP